jgi:hypothetical protein
MLIIVLTLSRRTWRSCSSRRLRIQALTLLSLLLLLPIRILLPIPTRRRQSALLIPNNTPLSPTIPINSTLPPPTTLRMPSRLFYIDTSRPSS